MKDTLETTLSYEKEKLAEVIIESRKLEIKSNIFTIKLENNPVANYLNIMGGMKVKWEKITNRGYIRLPEIKIVKGSGGKCWAHKQITIGYNQSAKSMGYSILHESAHWLDNGYYSKSSDPEPHNCNFRQILYFLWRHELGVEAAEILRKFYNSNNTTKGIKTNLKEFEANWMSNKLMI